MKSAFLWTCALSAALVAAEPGYCWGVEGHKAMAIEAAEILNPGARDHVKKILGSDDLSSIANWMDQAREAHFHAGPLGSDSEALEFNHTFPENAEWHYVDFPLGSKAYDPDSGYARPNDVVHMLEAAIDVLEGRGDTRITKLQALRMLVHFCGDIHQPLHVANGFFRISDAGVATLVTDPSDAEGLPDDKGANALHFGKGRFDELHGYWDVALVEKIGGGKDPVQIAGLLSSDADHNASAWADAGDYHHWPEAWATESIVAARTAYAGIVFGATELDPQGGIRKIWITFPKGYDQVAIPLARERLAKSGYRLAELLNSIHWAD